MSSHNSVCYNQIHICVCVCVYIYIWNIYELLMGSWASLVAQKVKNPPAMQDIWVQFLGWEDPLEKWISSILDYPLQYSCLENTHGQRCLAGCSPWDCKELEYSRLENPMDGRAWRAAVHGVAKSQTRLSDFTFTFHFDALEKEMAAHSSVLAWRIPGMGEPGGLSSLGSHTVGHDWRDLAAAAATKQYNGAQDA